MHEDVEELSKKLNHEDFSVRLDAVEEIGKIKNCRAVQLLISALNDNVYSVQRKAAKTLCTIGTPAIEELISSLLHHNPELFEKALEILNIIDPYWRECVASKKQVQELIKLLKAGNNDHKENAAKVLVTIGKITCEPLIPLLIDNNVQTRKQAKSALDKIDPNWFECKAAKQHIPQFIGALKDTHIKEEAAGILIMIGNPAIDLLISTLRDRDDILSQRVDELLSKMNPNWYKSEAAVRQIPEFINTLKVVENNDMERTSRMIIKIGEQAIKPMIPLLIDKNPSMQKHAEAILNEIDPTWYDSKYTRNQIPKFIEALKDEHLIVREKAIEILGKIKDSRAVDPLIDTLKDKEQHIQKLSAIALEGMGASVMPSFIVALRNMNPLIRKHAMELLSKINPNWYSSETVKEQIPQFIKALKNIDIRACAFDVLVMIGRPAMEYLISALRKDASIVREHVGNVLLKIDQNWFHSNTARQQVSDFILTTRSADAGVRCMSVDVLSKIEDTRAIIPFIVALRDEDEKVVKLATDALFAFGKQSIEPLISSLKEPDEITREKAKEILYRIDTDWQKSEAAKRHIPEFIRDIRSQVPYIAEGATEGLVTIGALAVPELIPLLLDSDENVRTRTFKALDRIDPYWINNEITKRHIPEFINKYANAQEMVEFILVKIGKPAVKPLISAVGNGKHNYIHISRIKGEYIKFIDAIYTYGVRILGKIGDACALEQLVHVMRSIDTCGEAIEAIEKIVSANQQFIESFPYLFCTECSLRAKKENLKASVFKSYPYVVCRCCNSSLSFLKGVNQVVGLIGSDIGDYKQDGEKVYVNLWFEADKKARNADIDILEIHESNGVSYDYAVNAVLNVLKNDVSRPRKYVGKIPVIIKGKPPLSENSIMILKYEFGGIKK